MSAEHSERPATYTAADLRAADLAGYARGFADGRSGVDAEADAQAAAFAEHVHRTFADSLPHAELAARRDGPNSPAARRAREVHGELLAAVSADATGTWSPFSVNDQDVALAARPPHPTTTPRRVA